MKSLSLVLLIFSALSLNAQSSNVFLDQAFWRNTPDSAAIQAEINKGNNPSEANRMGFDAVVYAINANVSLPGIKLLLAQKGNDVNKLTHDARTYLFWAANKGNVAVMQYLIQKGAKVDIEDSHGFTPMGLAAAGGQTNTEVYEACIAGGANIKQRNNDGATLLLQGIAADTSLKLTDYFISKGLSIKDVDNDGNTAFNYAARGGNISLLKALQAKGVKYTDNAMIMASQGTRRGANKLEVFQYLESLHIKPAAINKKGENALHAIVRKPAQENIIRYFLEKGTDVNQADEDGNTVFMNAAAATKDTVVLSLLQPYVKNINAVNKKGVAALAMAVKSSSAQVVAYLIRKGANINVFDTEGDNIAYYLLQSYGQQQEGGRGAGGPARTDEFEAKLKVLADNGFAITTPQKNGNTLYHLAVAKNDIGLLKRIAGFNVDVNAKNNEGLTPLHKAAMIAKDDAVMKYLISVGAKKDATTGFKETPFDLAKENESLAKNNVSLDFLK